MASIAAVLRAYELGDGDIIYVDTGDYTIIQNIDITADDSGVEIRGPAELGNVALLDRANLISSTRVFELFNADDVTLANLEITGAYYGIYADSVSDSDGLTLENLIVRDNSQYGAYITTNSDQLTVTGGQYFGHGSSGIRLINNVDALIDGIEAFSNNTGVEATNANATTVIRNSEIHDNNFRGITAFSSTVENNVVYGHTGSNDVGISGGSRVTGNEVFGNWFGIDAGGALVDGNEVYANLSIGINATNTTADLVGNRVYSNPIGISVSGGAADLYSNLIYDNTNQGVVVSFNTNGIEIVNNTIYQSVGDALVFTSSGNANALVANNILWSDIGTILSVNANAQLGFQSDYNLFYRGSSSAANIGEWGSTSYADLAAWQGGSGQGSSSLDILPIDPLFLDIDGADNVFGEQGVSEGNGADDNFNLQAFSPAIDRANGYVAPFTDLLGRNRQDDPSTDPNGGIGFELFVEGDTGSSSFTTGGLAQNWRSPNQNQTYNLPFAFNFYGTDYNSVTVNTNGYLQFAGPNGTTTGANDNSLEVLQNNVRIAPLWDDLQTNVTGGDVFIDETVANQTTIRWQGNEQNSNTEVNFSVTLFDDGTFRFDYGNGNQNLSPTIGVSAGNGVTFVLSGYNGATSLTNANSVTWTPTEGLTYFDIGAYEFQGDSGDVTPPTGHRRGRPAVPAAAPPHWDSPACSWPSASHWTASARAARPTTSLSRPAATTHFDTGDDVAIAINPAYSFPETNLTLELLDGVLPDGEYRLTLSGTLAIFDTAGNPLDGNADGTGGDDFIYFLTVDRSNNTDPVADAQAVSVNEDDSILITLTGSDADAGDVLSFGITVSPDHGTLSGFDPVAGTVTYTPDADYNGPDNFTFQVDDGKTGTAEATGQPDRRSAQRCTDRDGPGHGRGARRTSRADRAERQRRRDVGRRSDLHHHHAARRRQPGAGGQQRLRVHRQPRLHRPGQL